MLIRYKESELHKKHTILSSLWLKVSCFNTFTFFYQRVSRFFSCKIKYSKHPFAKFFSLLLFPVIVEEVVVVVETRVLG